MIVGLLGDTHGNALALEAVLAAASKAAVEELVFTGDFVGYYFSPRRVLELLSDWKVHCVRGNHEDMLQEARINQAVLPGLEARYGSGLRIALEELDPAQLDWLINLPRVKEVVFDSCRILLCHGSPWDTDQYIYPDANADLLMRCALPEFDFVIMGHTHYPMIKKVARTTLINPGSVGQPRHRVPGACWAVLDTQTREINFRNETYAIQTVIDEAKDRHPEIPYLAQVLGRK